MGSLLDGETEDAAERLRERVQRLFGHSLHIRHVDAGSCNACESEIKLLLNPYYDVQRLGIFFTTSPRHADLLLVTGPVTRAMEDPLRQTYEAMPDPRLVVAVGACACSGGIFGSSAYAKGGVGEVLPVDVFIPGCPPSPLDVDSWLAVDTGAGRAAHARTYTSREGRPTAADVFARCWREGARVMDWNLLPNVAFWGMLVLYLLGIVFSLVLQQARAITVAAAVCVALGGLGAMIAGIGVLSGAPPPFAALETNLPFGALSLHLDMLSAFFLAVIGLISLPVAVYSIGYLGYSTEVRRLRTFGLLFNLLLLSLVLIIAAADAIVFLMAWEAMAFLSYMMVNFDYEDPHVVRSSFLMLAVSELGTIGIVIAFLLLYQAAGSFSFGALRTAVPTLSLPVRSAVFLLAFFGFGAKAGVLPLQLWLPEAHPAAPSHISALLSAVIIKLGIYGMLLFLLDFLGGPTIAPAWWGLVILSVGSVTALVGILYAVVQHDLKRILAYSSIENIGIILAGLGAALTFRAYHLTALAAIAAIVTLYHILNHAVYKGLLFLGAGSVQHATGTRDLAKLGGLLRLMPWTGLFFIVAALAISAVPPFNGYISEWMLLETLLQSFAIPDTLTKVVIAISGALLALTAGIAVTAFVRATGVSFLAMPRSKEAASAHESPISMRVAMGFLAFFCLALGVLPTFVIPVLDHVTTPLFGQSVLNQVVPPLFTNHPGSYQLLVTIGGGLFGGWLPVNGLVVIPAPGFSTIDSPSYLFLAELLLIGMVLLALRLIRTLGSRRVGRVWAGGIPRFAASMTYSSLAYSNPIRIIFNALFRSRVRSESTTGAARSREGDITYQQEIPPPFERSLYQPLLSFWGGLTRRARFIQSGNINQYIAYIFVIVLIVLLLRAI